MALRDYQIVQELPAPSWLDRLLYRHGLPLTFACCVIFWGGLAAVLWGIGS